MGEKQKTKGEKQAEARTPQVNASVYICSSSQVSQLLPQLNLLSILSITYSFVLVTHPVHRGKAEWHFKEFYCMSISIIHSSEMIQQWVSLLYIQQNFNSSLFRISRAGTGIWAM